MKSLVEYIEESMLKHIAIEIQENDIIYEKYGLYDGCKELVEYIGEKIKGLTNDNKEIIINYNEIKNIHNITFDKLVIRFSDSNNTTGSYYPYKNQWLDINSGRFEKIQLQLNTHFPITYIDNNIKKVIAHELTHIYNDYLITKVGESEFYKLVSSVEYQRNSKFNKPNYHPNIRKLLRAIYMLNDYERNGFIASLSAEIEHIKEKPLK